MLILYDPYANAYTHFEFNRDFIQLISLANNHPKIKYFGMESQIALLKPLFEDYDIEFMPIDIKRRRLKKSTKLSRLSNRISQMVREVKIIWEIKKYPSNDLYVLFTFFQTILLTKIFTHNKNIYFNFHERIEEVVTQKSKFNWVNIFSQSIIRLPYSGKYKYMVLSSSILHNLSKLNLLSSSSLKYFFAIDQSFASKVSQVVTQSPKNHFKLGSIGGFHRYKSSQSIFILEDFINNQQLNISLYHIGKLLMQIPEESNIQVPFSYSLTSQQMLEHIGYLDYILNFSERNVYQLRISGTILDAISFIKPIVAIKNDYTEYIFNRCGNIGYLCENMEEMFYHISNIAQGKYINEYNQQLINLKNAQQMFTIEKISKDLIKIIQQ